MGGGGRSCTVIGCLSRSSTQKDKHFYRFPSDPIFKDVWIIFTRRGNDYQIKKSSVVCQDHFDPSCFVVKKKQICLAKNTIPTIFYRSTPEGEFEKYVLTFDRDVMHYVEEDTLLNPVYDKEKHEVELLSKKQRKIEEIGKLCRFCLEDRDEKLIEISKLKDYSISPSEVLALVGLNPKHNDLFSKRACEECFQQIFVFDGYRKRCKKSQDFFVDEINQIEIEIQKLFGNSGQEKSWMKKETTNWSDEEDEEEEATCCNDSFESNQLSPFKQGTVFQFQKIVVKEEQKDYASDEEYQDFQIPSIGTDDKGFPKKNENDIAIGVTAIKALTKYENDSYDIKDVFMPEKNQSSNSRIYECFYCRLVSTHSRVAA